MACAFPRYRLPIPEDVKFNPAFKSFGWIEKSHAFIWDKRNDAASEQITYHFNKYINNLQEIPCGECIFCRIKKSKELAQRALAECTMHQSSWFITLTYDDAHLQHTNMQTISRTSGEFGNHPCLIKRDFQLFVKNLRKTVSERGQNKIVVFYCGEYGPLNGRPHFHAIIYGLELHDLKLLKTENGISYFTSDTISDAWKDYAGDKLPRGFHTITEVNWDTCAYVARYVTKKMLGKSNKDYEYACQALNCEPQLREFHQGPKRPGLGLTYYDKNKDSIYEFDKVVLPQGKIMKPCSYYDKKFDIDYPGELEPIKELRNYNAKLRRMRELFGVKDVEAYEKAKLEKMERRFKMYKRASL